MKLIFIQFFKFSDGMFTIVLYFIVLIVKAMAKLDSTLVTIVMQVGLF